MGYECSNSADGCREGKRDGGAIQVQRLLVGVVVDMLRARLFCSNDSGRWCGDGSSKKQENKEIESYNDVVGSQGRCNKSSRRFGSFNYGHIVNGTAYVACTKGSGYLPGRVA